MIFGFLWAQGQARADTLQNHRGSFVLAPHRPKIPTTVSVLPSESAYTQHAETDDSALA